MITRKNRGKRKDLNSDSETDTGTQPDDFKKPKRVAKNKTNSVSETNSVLTDNRYDSLSNMDEDEDEDYRSVLSGFTNSKNVINSNNNTKSKSQSIKPIITDSKDHDFEKLKNTILKLNLSDKFLIKKLKNETFKITTFKKEDKVKILQCLKEINCDIDKDEFAIDKKYNFHTFSEPEDKSSVYVLKGHYYMECQDLYKKLVEAKVPVAKVSFLNNNKESPSYIIHFANSEIALNHLTSTYRVIDCLVVTWQKFNKSKKKFTQCFNCQQYGHTARNCGKAYKCVKCVETHLPGQCARKTKEGSPKCVNCGGDHAANSKLCKVFVEYKQKIESIRNKRSTNTFTPKQQNINHRQNIQQVSSQHTANPWTVNDFPPLTSKPIDPRERVGENNLFSSYSQLQNEFNSIPDMKQTLLLFKELINKLKSTNDHNVRLSILLQYQSP